jgi:hypothetical protein
VVDFKQRHIFAAELDELLQRLGGDFIAGFEIDLARLDVDDVLSQVAADQRLVGDAQRLDAPVAELLGKTCGDLLAGLDDDFARSWRRSGPQPAWRPSACPGRKACASLRRRASR